MCFLFLDGSAYSGPRVRTQVTLPAWDCPCSAPLTVPFQGHRGAQLGWRGQKQATSIFCLRKKLRVSKLFTPHDLKYRLGTRREAMKANTRVQSRALGWAERLRVHVDSHMILGAHPALDHTDGETTRSSGRRGQQAGLAPRLWGVQESARLHTGPPRGAWLVMGFSFRSHSHGDFAWRCLNLQAGSLEQVV